MKCELTGSDGQKTEINLDNLGISTEQKAALEKLVSSGSLDALGEDEKSSLKSLKLQIGASPDDDRIIVDFNLDFIIID